MLGRQQHGTSMPVNRPQPNTRVPMAQTRQKNSGVSTSQQRTGLNAIFNRTKKAGKNEIVNPYKSSSSIITHEKPHTWPNTSSGVNFPAPIRTPGTNNGRKPIDREHVRNTIAMHREEMNAYHMLHRDYAATHGIGTPWSQS